MTQVPAQYAIYPVINASLNGTSAVLLVTAHSFMIFTAKLLPAMSQAAGIPYVAAGQQMLGGSRVIQHWNLPDD